MVCVCVCVNIYIYIYIYIVEYYSAIKKREKNEVLFNNMSGPRGFILSEMSSDKDK